MHPVVHQLTELYGQLLQQYLKALELGSAIVHLEADEIVDALDQRDRILKLTAELKISVEKKEQESIGLLSPAEQAFLKEQKARLKDLKPKFLEQNRRVSASIQSKLATIRTELAGQSRNVSAIRKYLSSPGSKPTI